MRVSGMSSTIEIYSPKRILTEEERDAEKKAISIFIDEYAPIELRYHKMYQDAPKHVEIVVRDRIQYTGCKQIIESSSDIIAIASFYLDRTAYWLYRNEEDSCVEVLSGGGIADEDGIEMMPDGIIARAGESMLTVPDTHMALSFVYLGKEITSIYREVIERRSGL